MSVFIHQIETAVPEHRYSQDEARERLKAQLTGRRAKKIVQTIFNQSAIAQRHSAIGDYGSNSPDALFRAGPDGRWIEAGTGERNKVFAETSRRMSVELARRLLRNTAGIKPADVTHVITASCTGFYNPGPDYHIMRDCGLAPATERYHLGFMGCYAAFPALRMARAFCEANPDAVVLVMCLELCTLHLQLKEDLDTLLANSLFADGAAAAIVSARAPVAGTRAYRMHHEASALVPAGEKDMTWDIGNRGFNIALSSYVPEILGANIRSIVAPILLANGLELTDIAEWAVHGGGKAILDKVAEALALAPSRIAAARDVLRDYGNMSSPTILFVLKHALERAAELEGGLTCAMAFGPGLTVEMALLEPIHAPVPARASTTEVARV